MTLKIVITQTCNVGGESRELDVEFGDVIDSHRIRLGGWRPLTEGKNALHVCPECIDKIRKGEIKLA